MGRNSCFVKQKLKKGLWSPEEDEKLYNYISAYGVGCWSSVPKLAGLQRCGKSCRLRWINYLRPDLKRGMFSQEEEDLIMSLHEALGNRWAQISSQLPGRTDNEIKNFWNSSLKKKLIKQGIDPNTHKPIPEAQIKDEKECAGPNSIHILQPNGPQDPSISARMDPQGYHLITTGEFQQAVYDPTFLSEFVDPSFGFDSMPNLTNLTDYSDSSASRMSEYVMNEVRERESSSNSSNVNSHPRIQMNGEVLESSRTFSWEVENKVDTMFQFQFEESKQFHDQSSEDFSDYALTSLSQEFTDAFQQI